MTDEEKRIAIGEACGWRDAFPGNGGPHPLTKKGGILLPYKWVNERTEERVPSLPNFLHDLNAMYEAEETLRGNQFHFVNYPKHLFEEVSGKEYDGDMGYFLFNFAHATARQRAEAFLKTIQS